MKVMIVEDDVRIRQLIRTVTAGVAIDFYECDDGMQALDSYTLHRPDWVLMDLVMPRVDGITAIEQIKAVHPEARIIVITSHTSAVLRREAERAGVFAYLLKEDLLDLRELLGINSEIGRADPAGD